MSFEDLGLSEETLRAVHELGYTEPTPIQEKAIPQVLMGRDVLGCAQTGTGKTASFTLPMLDILDGTRARARMPRVLILEPTRELATQVDEAFQEYGKYHKFESALLIGGSSMSEQERRLERNISVLIATPGRLLDMVERGHILTSGVKILVIDEADRMLDMGFIPDVERIVAMVSPMRQTLFFSATMPPEIRRLADAFLLNPKEISVAPPASPAETVQDRLVVVSEREKGKTLRALLNADNVDNALIFCNRKKEVDMLRTSLVRNGFDAAAIHGDLHQAVRTETLQRFRDGKIRILVASDVAARGLDIDDLSHVFNYDVPHTAEDYIHRIGRTGRAGKVGHAFTIATPEDGKFVVAIEALIGREIPRIEVEETPNLALEEGDDSRRRGRGPRKPAKDGPSTRRREPKTATAQVTTPVVTTPEVTTPEAIVEDGPTSAPATAPAAAAEVTGEERSPRRRRSRRGTRGDPETPKTEEVVARPEEASVRRGRGPRGERGEDRAHGQAGGAGGKSSRERGRADEGQPYGSSDDAPAFLFRRSMDGDT
jgi:superfamily II DNA/RNA helicase